MITIVDSLLTAPETAVVSYEGVLVRIENGTITYFDDEGRQLYRFCDG